MWSYIKSDHFGKCQNFVLTYVLALYIPQRVNSYFTRLKKVLKRLKMRSLASGMLASTTNDWTCARL